MQLVINDIVADGVLGDVAITLTTNNLSEIVTKNGSYSNTFQLAITNNNKKIFDSAEIVISESGNAYKKLPCKIIVDGLEVVNGFCILKSSKREYSVSVFSGNSNFHSLIKEFNLLTIKDKFDILDHDTTNITLNTKRNNTTDLIYPNIDYGFFEKWSGSLSTMPQYGFFYSIYAKYILQKVVDNLGYRLSGELWNNSVYQNLALPCNKVIDPDQFNTEASTNYIFGELSGFEKYISFKNVSVNDGDRYDFLDIPTIGNVRAYQFSENPTNNFLRLDLGGRGQIGRQGGLGTQQFDIELRIIDKTTGAVVGVLYGRNYLITSIASAVFLFDDTAYSLPNKSLINFSSHCLVWWIKSTSVSASLAIFRTIEDITWSFTDQLGAFDFKNRVFKSLPSFKVSDLYNSILNIEGAFSVVDENTKEVRAIYYDDLKANISNAYDWSKLLDLSEDPEIEYRFSDYAQQNIFKYDNDEDDVYLQQDLKLGEGYLNIEDTTLEKSKEVVKIPFGLCSVQPTANGRVTMAKIYTGEKYVLDNGVYNIDPEAKAETIEPRLVKLTDSLTPIYIAAQVIPSRDVDNSIGFDKVVPKRYSLHKDITNKTKIVKALFRLSVNDIYEFDFTRPVYVKYFGEYFYVNEISQFKFNKKESTQVELIRL